MVFRLCEGGELLDRILSRYLLLKMSVPLDVNCSDTNGEKGMDESD